MYKIEKNELNDLWKEYIFYKNSLKIDYNDFENIVKSIYLWYGSSDLILEEDINKDKFEYLETSLTKNQMEFLKCSESSFIPLKQIKTPTDIKYNIDAKYNNINISLRNDIVSFCINKIIKSETTIPELGYKRASKLIEEFNKKLDLFELETIKYKKLIKK